VPEAPEAPVALDAVDALDAEARAVVAEEEALLARVLAALEGAAGPRSRAQQERRLAERLAALREEARGAAEADLPHVLQQLAETQALLERPAPVHALPASATPYFAHLRTRSAAGVRDYLLGRTAFTDAGRDVRIIDWRHAPVARVFYGYEEGDAYEEWLGERLVEGQVEVRRQVVIERGVLTRIRAGALQLEREAGGAWRRSGEAVPLLGGGAGTAARAGFLGVGAGASQRKAPADITALLDAEQYRAVTTPPDAPLLVLGSAGSGKTTVALHRLAAVALHPERPRAQRRLKVVVPEEGLARLSRRLLDPLGLQEVPVETLDGWALSTAKRAFGRARLPVADGTPALVSRLKRHPALRPLLAERLAGLPRGSLTLPRLRRRLLGAFGDRPFVEAVVAASGGDLPTTAVEETVRHTARQLDTPLLRELEVTDPERLRTVDGLSVEEDTPAEVADTLDVEDLPLLLFALALNGALGLEPLAHAVLDEAEDFSRFELFVLGRLLEASRSCTLSGDELQQTASGFAGWEASLAEVGAPGAAVARLQVSYRCPRPVVELARHVLGPLAPPEGPHRSREGAPVGFHPFPEDAQTQLFLRDALRDLLLREPRASVAVIASSPAAARAFHRAVEDLPATRLVLQGDFTFEPGLDVTDVDSVKGLEFDYVVLPDVSASAYPVTDEARRKLHVAVTRTSHQLWVASSGVPSRLLP
jgi:DNA helicase IV